MRRHRRVDLVTIAQNFTAAFGRASLIYDRRP